MDRRQPHRVHGVDVADLETELHGLEPAGGRFGESLTGDPVDAGRGHQRRRAVERREVGIGTLLEQTSHHRNVADCAARMNAVWPVKSTHSSEPSGSI